MIYRDINGNIIVIRRDNYVNEQDFNNAVYELKNKFYEKYKAVVYIEPPTRDTLLASHT